MIVDGVRRWLLRLLLGALLLAVPLPAASAVPITARDVALNVRRSKEGMHVTLEFLTIVAPSGDRLSRLLESHGVVPDAEAFAVVYADNPKINSSTFKVSTSVRLPTIRTANGSECGYACAVALTWDAPSKRKLDEVVTTSRALLAAVSKPNDSRPRRAQTGSAYITELTAALSALANMNQIIRSRSKPLSRELLTVTLGEAELLQSLLEQANSGSPATSEATATVTEIATDIGVRLGSFDEEKSLGDMPGPLRQVPFVVKIIADPTKPPATALRVYWSAVALYNNPEAHKQLSTSSSPVTAALGEANYLFWAARPGDDKPVTDILRVELRAGDPPPPRVIELVVK